ncbi:MULTISPECIES: RluA family pseudouridine synthase [unclassified Tolypothrix]|uniref:RluA family pseudouridine synthase n=1 Tax=unclassified Tolypothrix TaxID=2649714 RepID=UPI0005EAAAF9|nr:MULTISPECIES: RluA family pseudouridine synthase [unclassified Tolypothrix]BAY94871.1 ribosomal large subunit pseudouridine synthase D [Microchaete diplosiphon NIES-3275]EKF00911.1 pseudouridine synthase, RluA family [Tolypothrix sp. PCC 7601]MBE9087585.1 RluA family pseudouridine synthase [Tolypothrix sp. LEGE 11397]UYD28516.1 RluA family pseudouridine synthase [Tolypothrix sp. PCC 7712]UYD35571.1 RluA family pseudouridine synthase [Tolypothrix sp. PCC 7601]
MTEFNLQVQDSSERLDRYLSQELPDLSRSRIQQLIEQGNVQLNGKVCTSKKINVKTGDRITLEIPEAQPLQLQAEDIALDILYEDDQLLILNKPAGLVVHPAPGHPDGTLVNALLAHCPNLPGIGGVQRPGIVHRLDKDTTGAIAIAKTDIAYQHLQAQLQAKTARREYLGVVYGAPKAESGVIDFPIGRHRQDRKKMAVVPIEEGGRNAITHWQVRERLGNYTLIHFQLETGRTHQIRVHSAKIGHPIVGDPVYGSGRSIGVNLPGQALHAWRLKLQHPISGDLIEVTAPPPQTFVTLLEVLRRRAFSSAALERRD